MNNFSFEFTPTESSPGGTLLYIANHLWYKPHLDFIFVFLLGDFNVNVLSYNNHNPTNKLLDFLASNSFVPYSLQPTRLTSHSKTLTDNIFSNIISPEAISGNLTSTISDHLPQLMIVLNVLCNPS